MRDGTRSAVKEFVKRFATETLARLKTRAIDDLKKAYPFHALFFPDEAFPAFKAERTVVTAMGRGFNPGLARIIASDRHSRIFIDHTVEGTLNDAACNRIEEIITTLRATTKTRQELVGQSMGVSTTEVQARVNDLRKRRQTTKRQLGKLVSRSLQETPEHEEARQELSGLEMEIDKLLGRPNHDREMASILAHTGGGTRTVSTTADIYIGDFAGGEFFAEIKSPLPNLDVAAESKKKMLYFLAMRTREGVSGVSAYLAFPYNPYLTRGQYNHSFTRQIMDLDKEVLMGEEFWNLIGGQGTTFSELLEILDEARSEISLLSA